MPLCPVCKCEADAGRRSGGDFKQFACPRCGNYEITGSALAMLPARLESDEARSRARLSHAIRIAGSQEEWPVVNSMNLDQLVKQSLPSIERQTLNLLRWAAARLEDDQLGVVELPDHEHLAGIVGTIDGDRVDELVSLAAKDGLVKLVPDECISLTPQAWRRLEGATRPAPQAEVVSTPASTEKPKAPAITTAHCNNRGDRRAFVRASHTVNGSDEEVSWSDTYDVLECCGCETVYVRHEHWFSEHDWIDEDAYGRPRLNRGIDTKYWPPAVTRVRPEWADKVTDATLRKLMTELYGALDAGLVVLATTGARTLFDRASTLQVGDPPGGFAGKLNAMVTAEHISASDRRILEAMTDAGSASAHRGFAPDLDQLNAIVDILENYLERLFVLSAAADALRSATPQRQKQGRR